ncbi:olfactory receptor 12D2 [Xenopus tropicalis]|uniref:Olfactory receptor n=2 Tax=Xenopus tropicalis TaxID=8364 RepID=A0A8J0QZ47_XENTR|nr:olfactory receptor 12D2 [Xenopus tropicalis]
MYMDRSDYMDSKNQTSIGDFTLIGLTDLVEIQCIVYGIFLLFYCLTLLGNISIMITTIRDSNLHTPMYFFLWNLSFIDIGFSSVSVPKMLTDFFATRKLISFGGCMSQICFFHFFGTAEVLLLAVMSYDRFVAIGNPLRYILIMNSKVCLSLALSCWISGFFHSLLHTVMTAKLPYCQANLVNHFFCDVKPVLKLACTDTSFILQLLTRVAGSVSTITFAFTFLSYFFIIKFVIQIRTKKGRRNAFSTCSAHLTVVFMLYGTAIFTYMRPLTQQSLDHDRVVAVLFTVVTPALNPLIYTLRNKEMRVALKRIYKNVFYL